MRAIGRWLSIFLCAWLTAYAFAEGQPLQTSPFRIALLFLALAAVAGVFRLYMKLEQRAASLETMIGERTAELLRERVRLNAVNGELAAAKEIQRAHRQLLSVLDQLTFGVIIVNPRQEILFVSEVTRQLLKLEDDVIGSTIERVLPIQPEAMAEVQMRIRNPRPRPPLTTRLDLPSKQQAWAELDVRRDPREPSNGILYLYRRHGNVQAEAGAAVRGVERDEQGARAADWTVGADAIGACTDPHGRGGGYDGADRRRDGHRARRWWRARSTRSSRRKDASVRRDQLRRAD